MERHRHGGDIYTTEYRLDFSANVNPLGMPERVKEAAFQGVRLSEHYPDVRLRSLRQALSQKEGVPQENLIFGNGAAELIFLLVQAQKPQKALLLSPGFAEYEQALHSCGCAVSWYGLKRERGFALGEDFTDCLTEDLDLLFLCNPNNPTGVQIPRALLEKTARVCEEKKIRMVLDVCFRDFLDEPGETDLSAADFPHLFLLKAFTKTYAMAGLRLGYGICADQKLLADMEALRQPWSVSLPAQMAGEAALQEEDYVRRARALVKEERAWLTDRLRALGFEVCPPAANFIFFCGEKGLAERMRRQGILIRDCGNYRGLADEDSCGHACGYYRVAVKTHEENEELIRVLARCRKWRE